MKKRVGFNKFKSIVLQIAAATGLFVGYATIDAAHAAVPTYCYYNAAGVLTNSDPTPVAASLLPASSEYSLSPSALTCSATINTASLPTGVQLVSDPSKYYNSDTSKYVADGDPCTIGGKDGIYVGGVCTKTQTDASSPNQPTPTIGNKLTTAYQSVTAPNGGSAMCSSGALSTGAAVFGFVFTGAICQANAIAGSSQIYAYDASGTKSQDGVNANQFWARDSITSVGLMTSLGGAQILSTDQRTGLIVDTDQIYMQSSNLSGNNISSLAVTPTSVSMGTAAISSGRTAVISVDSESNSTSAVSIYGDTGNKSAENTSVIGVRISGNGQNSAPNTGANDKNGSNFDPTNLNIKPNWADVLISSAHYNDSYIGKSYTPDIGSAIIVTDYGVQIVSPAPGVGQTITNNFGANTQDPLNITNGTTVNNIGGGNGITQNIMGNANGSSQVGLQAANSTTTIQNGINTTSLGGAGLSSQYGTGGSVLSLTSDTSSLNGAVLKDTQSTQVATVDAKGKISIVTAGSDPANAVAQTTSMMTVTNGIGNVHGFVVNEKQAVMSGGTQSTSFILDDNGATFSNVETGGPAHVHGIADGVTQFDAVNIRQLYGAVAASMATVPNFTVEPGETGIGFGTATMGQYPAIGMSFAKKNKNGSQINIGVAAAEHVPLAVRAGVGWVW